jgi:hypothetical protein
MQRTFSIHPGEMSAAAASSATRKEPEKKTFNTPWINASPHKFRKMGDSGGVHKCLMCGFEVALIAACKRRDNLTGEQKEELPAWHTEQHEGANQGYYQTTPYVKTAHKIYKVKNSDGSSIIGACRDCGFTMANVPACPGRVQ